MRGGWVRILASYCYGHVGITGTRQEFARQERAELGHAAAGNVLTGQHLIGQRVAPGPREIEGATRLRFLALTLDGDLGDCSGVTVSCREAPAGWQRQGCARVHSPSRVYPRGRAETSAAPTGR